MPVVAVTVLADSGGAAELGGLDDDQAGDQGRRGRCAVTSSAPAVAVTSTCRL